MKKIYTILFLLSFTFNFIFAQTSHPWELGINGGAAWYKSDVKMKKLGGGFGFTFGQSYCYNKNTALFWGWRFRYLGANTYGQDYQKSYGIKNNFALNGQSDTAINYVSNGGFVYQNYKSSLSEFSLEVKIGANQLRQKTKILAYVFGGAGLIKAVTYTDQLDANNKMYNYASIDSAGISGKGDILSRLNDMYDGNYETLSEGSKNPKWRFMPYVGAGLGYQFTPGFSMGLEHKMTWTRNDLVDGQQWTNTNEYTGTNDMYHYSSIWMKLSFGRKVKPTSSSTTTNNNSNVTNYTTDNTNTVVSIPVIKFTNPSTANYTSNQNTIIVKANISGVSNQSDITLTQNGNQVTNFTYNANVLTYTATLLTGDNSFVINATNVSGTATASANVNYTLPVVNSLPAPVITISSPNQNPFSTTMNGLSVLASVQNVSAANQITLTANGVNMPFNFSGNQLTYTANNLIAGSNTIVISATNTSGSDTKSITIIYNQPVALPAPVVLITSPASTNYNSSVSPLLVGASIQNITGIGQIAVTVNGGPVMSSALNFNPGTGQLSFNANLVQGSNAVIVSATNVSGADSKTLTVFYTAPVPVQLAPAITITNPVANPFTTNVNSQVVNATVNNVNSSNQISVAVNGTNTPFNFNSASKLLSFTTNLIQGANTITISASNNSGSDTKTSTIIYNVPMASQLPPVITISNPANNPFATTSSTQLISATVNNVSASNQISVTLNGAATNFNYNTITKKVSITISLIEGSNVLTITATNAAGSDVKTQTVIYNKPTVVPAPVVTILNPTANPFNSSIALAAVSAKVLNVTSLSQLSVKLNGSALASNLLNFNTSSGVLNFNCSLIQGANTISIEATNVSGTDSKTITIIYTIPAPPVVPPVVQIVSPVSNPYSTSVNTETVIATVLNVNSSNQIDVKLNGATIPFNFNSSNNQLSTVLNLISGSNALIISATNAAGNNSKSLVVNYTQPVQVAPPVVSFTNPATAVSSSNTSTFNIVAKALNVLNASQVVITVNGVAITNFTMQPITKKITFTANLNIGTNVITISASNSGGSDSKSVTINYTQLINPISPDTLNTPNDATSRPSGVVNLGGTSTSTAAKPEITISAPTTNPFVTGDATYTITGGVKDIASSANMTVKVNGNNVPFNYNPTKKTFFSTLNLVQGANIVLVEATNAAGTETKVITITKQ